MHFIAALAHGSFRFHLLYLSSCCVKVLLLLLLLLCIAGCVAAPIVAVTRETTAAIRDSRPAAAVLLLQYCFLSSCRSIFLARVVRDQTETTHKRHHNYPLLLLGQLVPT